MSFTAALLILAQSATPHVAEAPVVRSGPVAVQASASVRIIRPANIDFANFEQASDKVGEPASRETQRSRDAAGTPWIEFS